MQRAFDIASMNVTVIGAARSGLAAARLLHHKGVSVFSQNFPRRKNTRRQPGCSVTNAFPMNSVSIAPAYSPPI